MGLTLIPLVWFITFLAYVGFRKKAFRFGIFDSVVLASLYVGLLAFSIPQILSIGNHMTTTTVWIAWSISLVTSLLLGKRFLPLGIQILRARFSKIELTGLDLAFIALVFVFVFGTFAAATLYPPSNYDSMWHILPRVEQFAQRQSVGPFPTTIPQSNSTYPFAAYCLTQAKLLAGGSDSLLNLIQWFAYLVSALSVAAIARLLGASKRGSQLSMLVFLSYPMALLQSMTTQYDLFTTMWCLLGAYSLVRVLKSNQDSEFLLWAGVCGIASGLGINAKISYVMVLAPFFILLLVSSLRRRKPSLVIKGACICGMAVILLCAPWFGRNAVLYKGDILGTSAPGNSHILVPDKSVSALWSNSIRNFGYNLGTPINVANTLLVRVIGSVGGALGTPIDSPINKESADAPYALTPYPLHHDTAPAPLTVLILAVSMAVVFLRSKTHGRNSYLQTIQIFYTLASLLGIALVATFITSQPFIVRTFLPVFSILCPLVGIAWTNSIYGDDKRWYRMTSIILIVLITLSVMLGLFVLPLNRSNPLVPANRLFKEAEQPRGFWNTNRNERGYLMLAPFMKPEFDVVSELAAGNANQNILLGGDASGRTTVYPLLLAAAENPVFFGGKTAMFYNQPATKGELDPDILISFDNFPSSNVIFKAGRQELKPNLFTLVHSRRIKELNCWAHVWVKR